MNNTKYIYFAPLEGVTDSIFRNTFEKHYGGIDKYYTPFISPNSTFKFTTREFKDIDPTKNNISTTVPQLLTNNAEHFLWAVHEIAALGYKEINFNLGCPSGTVVAKKKGSGLLYYPEELDNMLYEVFSGLKDDVAVSIKTRLGKIEPDEFYEILDIYNKYPISELTIHPRVQKDFYREPIHPEFFEYAISHSKAPLVFNGEIKTTDDISNTFRKYKSIHAVMIGRGLITNPTLALEYKKGLEHTALDLNKFKAFHNELLAQYIEVLSGEKPVLHRMKEFLVYWEPNFPDEAKAIKKIRKSNNLNEYKTLTEALFQ
ncbi:tRNA dihydrouridine synthase [Pseudobutyrivibrio xylanivorans]|uniref:tRNA-dihydrouridine synthase n=1 Tax=Pseudobutyrivibrio xylanivorans DSM 14809 TaxID=1123012 RepID=A0A1M6EMU3_PSEXY|nr:tRNA-dihydrouridine synthase family protein [Pseudobutyrivibrio xylanivorans]SHI86867.1 tRNA-dihydrouridine synthase [Pseudobutyrivibrio xylanivorans DSM 14809]